VEITNRAPKAKAAEKFGEHRGIVVYKQRREFSCHVNTPRGDRSYMADTIGAVQAAIDVMIDSGSDKNGQH
jgi:hypothetical protein